MPDNGYINGYYKGHPLGKPLQDKLVTGGITGEEVPRNTTRFGTVTQDALVEDESYNFNEVEDEEEG